MTTITLYNTKTRAKERFEPIDPDNVRMYVCGPTVYDRAHLGNARPVVVFDVLYRLLRHVYGADHVTYVRNITDVEDKIITRAEERGISIEELTATTARWFYEDMAALGVDYSDDPHFKAPHATGYIGEMIAMIESLIARGHAYAADGHVLFDVHSYKDYGQLSGRSVDDMIAGARVEVAPYKRDPMDFVLWKPSSEDQPGWDSPWGRGRPGWHIECSAMSHALLGESFDIHGGGNDLTFPHHENEIAQSRCAHPGSDFARYWMHNEMLQVEGKKMSKSLGNFFTVRDLLDKGVPGEVIRFVFLSTHYRKPMDWTEKKAEEAAQTLFKWRTLTENVVPASDPKIEVIEALADDLNTPKAITELYKLEEQPRALLRNARILGLLEEGAGEWYSRRKLHFAANDQLRQLLRIRKQAKEDRNFVLADAIRDALGSQGITLADLPDGKVQPKTNFEHARNYVNGLSDVERKEIFGDIYTPDGQFKDGSAIVDRYIGLVAADVLAKLEALK